MKFKGLIANLPETVMKFIDEYWEYWFVIPLILGGLVVYVLWIK